MQGGRELLEQSLDHNWFPDACKRSYRMAGAGVAAEEKLPYIDVNDIFRRHANGPNPQEFYIDQCHPTPQGDQLITDALFDAIGSP